MLTGAPETLVKDAKKGSYKVVNVIPLFRASCLSQTTSLLTKTRVWGIMECHNWNRTKKPQTRTPHKPTRPPFFPYHPKQPNQSLLAEYSNRDKHTCSLL